MRLPSALGKGIQWLNPPEDLVMEYVTGGDLFDYINRNGRIRMFVCLNSRSPTYLMLVRRTFSSFSDDANVRGDGSKSPEQVSLSLHSGFVSIFIAKESRTAILSLRLVLHYCSKCKVLI